MRDFICFLELLKNTTKPIIGWITYPRSAQLIIEMMSVVAGGRESLKKYPPYEAFIEPVSPLQFTPEGLEILYLFAQAELPIGFGPMVAVSATGPCTLAGALAQENAEILAGITITQVITPGLPITYWGIPHLFDNRTGIMSFGSPEQGLMAAAITQLGKSYGFPVGNNTGLHDSKLPDAQTGVENGSTLTLGLLAGGDILGHLGICGADNGGNEIQLVIDNETAGYIRRIGRSLEVNETTLALEVIKSVGIGGNFLAEEHTLQHFKDDVWFPSFFDRFSWDVWEKRGKKSSVDLAREIHQQILATHQVEPLEAGVQRELEAIVKARRSEL
jgi:trimethylamine--corrinoid protein Co-methyltransferase